jgi:kynurenine/2-aminoadipate aminotransferase
MASKYKCFSHKIQQVLVHGILSAWGISGLEDHVRRVRDTYRRRRDLMVSAAEKHLTGLAEWVPPKGGMFLWLRLLRVKDTRSMVLEHGPTARIMLLPGNEFMADRSAPSPFLRASFSILEEEEIDVVSAQCAQID